MSARDAITMSDAELDRFLDAEQCVSVATRGHDGWPHVMPLWFVVREREVWIWTYGTSQKVRNLERDPRATLMVEAGESYDELRGVMIKAEAVIERDHDAVTAVGIELFGRYLKTDELPDEDRDRIVAQSRKRVAIRFVEHSHTSWDHRKLAGA